MIKNILVLFCLGAIPVAAQINSPKTAARPRVVIVPSADAVAGGQPAPQQTPMPRVSPTPQSSPTPNNPRVVIVPSAPATSPTPTISPTPTAQPTAAPSNQFPTNSAYPVYSQKNYLNLGQFKQRLAEAKRFLQSRPQTIALTDDKGKLLNTTVTLALFDTRNNQALTASLPKETFLTLNQESYAVTSTGKYVRVRTLRANGVNTAVLVLDDQNQPLVPLLAQYPIEKNGKFTEMAYYTSAHPTLVSPETARAGQVYIRSVLETAIKNLRARGKFISPAVAHEAEKLCLVEHVDHQRFLSENRSALYNEIFTLFALNEGGTYRFAVSTAGAGGLVQMIPATYRMVRSMHPTVPLMPDFVEGMRNHPNAMLAMLLYMQDTYSDLIANETISNALADGTATDGELMAAGYNSNPARLHLYIRRGGANWRNLIPRETQMYLQIQKSIEATVIPLPPVK